MFIHILTLRLRIIRPLIRLPRQTTFPFRRRRHKRPIEFPLLIQLHELEKRLRNSSIISIVFLSFRSENFSPRLRGDLHSVCAPGAAAPVDCITLLDLVCDYLANIAVAAALGGGEEMEGCTA